MNRRKFIIALAALPIAAKFGGLVPAMPTSVTIPVQVEQYSDFLNFSDFLHAEDMSPMFTGEVGRLASVYIENESDVLTHLA